MEFPDLPWPRCLGDFDEESCRFFLHELGSNTVPYYPFSFGIEEVHRHILKEYGWDRVSDPLSILQELLEDEENAAGLGDDGDPWRSWRHSWRHRNIDPLNCFIPRVGHLILPRPTSARIRRLKAKNFIASQHDKINVPHPQFQDGFQSWPLYTQHLDEVLEQQSSFQSMLADRQPDSADKTCHASQISHSRTAGEDIEATTAVDMGSPSSDVDLDPAITLTIQALAALPQVEDLVLKPESSSDTAVATETSAVRAATSSRIPQRCADANTSELSVNGKKSKTSRTPIRDGSSESKEGYVSVSAKCPDRISTVGSSGEDFPGLGETTFNSSLLCSKFGLSVDQTTKPSQHSSAESHDSRVINRQARLVDGTILTSVPIKFSDDQLPDLSAINVGAGQRSCKEPNTKPTKTKVRTGKAWVFSILNVFRPDNCNNFLAKLHERYSMSTTSKTLSASHAHTTRPASAIPSSEPTGSLHQNPHSRFGLDGTTDSISDSSSYTVYLNKPLPLNPEDVVRSLSEKSHSVSARSSPHMVSTPSTRSSYDQSLYKVELQSVNNQRSAPKNMPQHELPPISELGNNEKQVGDPPKSAGPLTSPNSFRSFVGLNPWKDNDQPDMPNAPELSYEENNSLRYSKSGKKSRGLPVSHSAPAIHPAMRSVAAPSQPETWYSTNMNDEHNSSQTVQSDHDDRGRSQATSPGSGKIQKDKSASKTGTSQLRSRSPIKRMLWPSKNNRHQDDAAQGKPVASQAPEPKPKAKSMKTWGDKIRHGFLTPDIEQLKQEELMEQHANPSPPSTSTRSNFPVSMEPPHQAKLNSEMELMLAVTANRYLLREAEAGRISGESVAKLKSHWHALGRPEVIEFHYDQISQHDLVTANLRTLKLHGDAAKDPVQINSTLHGWKILAREMSIRTFCLPDSVIRKHLHDAYRVLELLGAPPATMAAFASLQIRVLTRITAKQQQRSLRNAGKVHTRSFSDETQMSSTSSQRNISQGTIHKEYTVEDFQLDFINLGPSPVSTPRLNPRKPTGAEGAIMNLPLPMPRSRAKIINENSSADDPFDSSRGGRLVKMIQEKPEDVLLERTIH